jgi:hypothetical protein
LSPPDRATDLDDEDLVPTVAEILAHRLLSQFEAGSESQGAAERLDGHGPTRRWRGGADERRWVVDGRRGRWGVSVRGHYWLSVKALHCLKVVSMIRQTLNG